MVGSKLPNFLIIGSMKSGTTTLYRDLYEHPDIFLPERKEPENLCSDSVLTKHGRNVYAGLFKNAKEGQIIGEASTAYTKWPDETGVPERAHAVLPRDFKIIYVVRDPVERAISQYRFELDVGWVTGTSDEAIVNGSRYLNYSRYALQISKWQAVIPTDRIMIIRFEDYVADRTAMLFEIFRFLGVDESKLGEVTEQSFNSAETRRVLGPVLKSFARDNPFYRHWIQPIIPWRTRSFLVRVLAKRVNGSRIEINDGTRQMLESELVHEIEDLEKQMKADDLAP